VALKEILITARLNTTPAPHPNVSEEAQALWTLARMLATAPQNLIDGLLEMALGLCHADTAGLSVLEALPDGEQVFRWTNLAGRLKQFVGGATPRHFSPCGVCLDHDAPQFFEYPARRFRYLSKNVDVPIVQALVIPVSLGLGAPATIWILAHEERDDFNAEDVRTMTELADFTGSVLALLHSLRVAQDSQDQAEKAATQLRTTQRDLEKSLEAQYAARRHAELEVTSRKLSEDELQKSHNVLESIVQARASQLRRLSAKLQILQDEERRRIARELHDSAGQYLSGIQMNLDACLREKTTWVSRVNEARELAEKCLAEIRTISYLLHPPLLDEMGLVSALSWFTGGFSERSGIRMELKVPRGLGRMPAETETAIFRVAQQALSNIHRHSGSKMARITITSDAEQVMLEVRDEGRGIPEEILAGFHAGTRLPGVGIAGMRERIANMGGKFTVRSGSQGTTLEIALPIGQE
jgi:signal transduction histidine kinase